MTPWIIALMIAALLLKAAFGSKQKAIESRTVEGSQTGLLLMTICAIAAMSFLLIAVILAK